MRNNPTILVVDDDAADQFLVQEAMRTANLHYSLRLVSDGEEAIEYLYHRGRYVEIRKAPRPDLILLDLNMPRLNGRQVARAIKSDSTSAPSPSSSSPPAASTRTSKDSTRQASTPTSRNPPTSTKFTEALRDLSAYWLGRATLPAGHR